MKKAMLTFGEWNRLNEDSDADQNLALHDLNLADMPLEKRVDAMYDEFLQSPEIYDAWKKFADLTSVVIDKWIRPDEFEKPEVRWVHNDKLGTMSPLSYVISRRRHVKISMQCRKQY